MTLSCFDSHCWFLKVNWEVLFFDGFRFLRVVLTVSRGSCFDILMVFD